MIHIPPETLVKIASESQFVWRPLASVNRKFNRILAKHDMYKYVNGPVFVCWCIGRFMRDNGTSVKSLFGDLLPNAVDDDQEIGERDMLVSYSKFKSIYKDDRYNQRMQYHKWIIFDWETVREYSRKTVGLTRYIMDTHKTGHFSIYIYNDHLAVPMINYSVNGEKYQIKCKILENMDEEETIEYRRSFDHLLKYIPNLDCIYYVIGYFYIPKI